VAEVVDTAPVAALRRMVASAGHIEAAREEWVGRIGKRSVADSAVAAAGIDQVVGIASIAAESSFARSRCSVAVEFGRFGLEFAVAFEVPSLHFFAA
jgi:hypothetical protein